MINIINEINADNGSNYKMDVLRKHKDNKLLQRVLKMTYDKVSFTYGISMKNINTSENYASDMSLEWALDMLENNLSTRKIRGNAAIELLEDVFANLDEDNSKIIKGVINRDLRINMGRSNINKVFKNLIVKPPYQRCDIGTAKNVEKNINFNKKVFSQVKMDGTYRSASVQDEITIMSRSGQEDAFPLIEKELSKLPKDYVYLGEMTLRGEQDRSKGNGLINSDNPPHDDIIFTIWDMIPITEYSMDKEQIKISTKNGTMSKYGDRLQKLENALKGEFNNIELIEYEIISNMKEAYEHFQKITKRGDEGTVIKTEDMTWKDGTSKQQLKVKLEIDAEVRITGFIEGTKGTKREKTFGSITFENDEGTIKGSTSGFTDKQLEDFNSRRDELIGKIITVQFNDITKGRANDYYALSHPRFVEIRNDKSSTDKLERVLQNKEMAMNLGGK